MVDEGKIGQVPDDDEFPGEIIRYDKELDMWVRVKDGIATLGITDFAQSELQAIAYVFLPDTDTEIDRDTEPLGSIEASKTDIDFVSPVSGTIVAVNEPLMKDRKGALVNDTPYTDGWIAKIKLFDPAEIEQLETEGALINAAAYREALLSR